VTSHTFRLLLYFSFSSSGRESEAVKALLTELARLRAHGLSAAELERARADLQACGFVALFVVYCVV
jgi:hypothetical protein